MKILVITNHNKKMQLCSLLADDAAACNEIAGCFSIFLDKYERRFDKRKNYWGYKLLN